MLDRTRDIALYQNDGALISLGASQIISFPNFDTSTSATKSFFLGPVGMSAMSASDRLEIMSLLPDLCTEEAHHVMPPARKFRVGHIAKSIVARAIQNASPVVAPRQYTSV